MTTNIPLYEELSKDITVLLGKKLLVSFGFSFSKEGKDFNYQEEAFLINKAHFNKNEKCIKLVFVCDGVEADVPYYTVGVHIDIEKGVTMYFSEIDGPDLFLDNENLKIMIN